MHRPARRAPPTGAGRVGVPARRSGRGACSPPSAASTRPAVGLPSRTHRCSDTAELEGTIIDARSRRFVALGDSFTEGLQDEVSRDGRHRGWADRVAHALAAVEGGLDYANLAVRGRLLGQVLDEQLPVALDLRPDLVSFHAGPNDVLRPRVDVPMLLDRYGDAVERLVDAGATVVLFTVIGRAGGRRGRVVDAIAERFAQFNDGVRRVGAAHDAVVVDVGAVEPMGDARLWHEDRLHLSPDGHRRVAAAVLEALGVDDAEVLAGAPGWWRRPLPEAPVRGRGAALAGEARWVARHLAPWVGRRLRGVSSGDAIAPKHQRLVHLPGGGGAHDGGVS